MEELVQSACMTLSRDILGVENLVIHCASHKLVTLYNLIIDQCANVCATYTDPADGEYAAADTRAVADALAAKIISMKVTL